LRSSSATGRLTNLSRKRDHIVATTPTHYLDMQSGFDPPPTPTFNFQCWCFVASAHTLRWQEVQRYYAAPCRRDRWSRSGANHFMIATHAERMAILVSNHVIKTVSPV